MTYDVLFSPKSKKFLKKLNEEVYQRIINKFKEVREDPFRYLDRFEGRGYKLRIGDYRAILDIDSSERIIWVRILDKRGRIYKR